MRVTLSINHQTKEYDIKPGEYLLDTLRKNHIYSVKRGCDTTSCGVCTVLVDMKPIASCTFLTKRAEGKEILTVEGIHDFAEKLADYMGHEGADQCGFCNPSLALAVYALRAENPDPSDEEINHYLIGHLCRCTGYQSQHIAIRKCLEETS
jgi:carbon-monoxide dehydrogenase small subunit